MLVYKEAWWQALLSDSYRGASPKFHKFHEQLNMYHTSITQALCVINFKWIYTILEKIQYRADIDASADTTKSYLNKAFREQQHPSAPRSVNE